MLNSGRLKKWIGSSIVAMVAMTGTAQAEVITPSSDTGVTRSELNALKAEINRLRAQQEESWLNERRAEEMKTLIREVLSDAETRSSLLADGAMAGHDGKHFFLASADGAFYMELAGHLQVRYIYNKRDTAGLSDDDQSGFAIRRSKFKAKGHIGDPKIKYAFSLANDSDSQAGDGFFEDYYLEYAFGDGWSVRAGRWKQPFARQNIVSSSRQMAVERGDVHEFFAVDRSEGVMLSYAPKERNYKFDVSLNNGTAAQFSDWDTNAVDLAITSRFETLIAGNWKQFKDFNAWSGEETGVLFGTAIHYQEGETGGSSAAISGLMYTADLSIESNGTSLFIAGYGQHLEGNEGPGVAPDFQDYGLEVTVGHFVIPDVLEPYIRFEYLRLDSKRAVFDEDVEMISIGFNYYQKKHSAKFTLDFVYAFDSLDPAIGNSESLGIDDDFAGNSGQMSIRAQYQITF